MQHQQPSLWPHPRKSWHQCWCRGRLPDVLCEFLGSGLVLRPVRLNEAQCVTCTLYYYYLLVYHYYILLLDLLLLIITVCYYTVITLLLRITTPATNWDCCWPARCQQPLSLTQRRFPTLSVMCKIAHLETHTDLLTELRLLSKPGDLALPIWLRDKSGDSQATDQLRGCMWHCHWLWDCRGQDEPS